METETPINRKCVCVILLSTDTRYVRPGFKKTYSWSPNLGLQFCALYFLSLQFAPTKAKRGSYKWAKQAASHPVHLFACRKAACNHSIVHKKLCTQDLTEANFENMSFCFYSGISKYWPHGLFHFLFLPLQKRVFEEVGWEGEYEIKNN